MTTADVQIKICGVRTVAHARIAIEAGADMIGLVFVPGSPRFVSLTEARQIIDAVGDQATVVGVFKDFESAHLRTVCDAISLHRVQLHGPVTLEQVRALAPTPVTVALSFDPQMLPQQLRQWQTANVDNLHALLIDTPDPTRLGGGTGNTFDWSALREVLDQAQLTMPVLLAGGLNSNNVKQAIDAVRPAGVDVSSGVESKRGVKDPQRITAFCRKIRRLN